MTTRLIPALGILLAGSLMSLANDVVIQSFESTGRIMFTEVASATEYSVEWASSLMGPWTNSWDAMAHLPATGTGVVTAYVPMVYRVVARTTNPPGMTLIPSGYFMMGNATNVLPASEGEFNEVPQHMVFVSAFYMDIYEVTKALWDDVKAYNGGNGYDFSNEGSGKATNHPVHTVNWFDVVKWCNARSQRDGLTPVYYTEEGFTNVYKTGEIAPYANWTANGYRLPTEAEWEKAARGGVADTRFPWHDYTNNISWAKANYFGESDHITYDLSGGSGAYHPTFATDDEPFTSPVGYFSPNEYGLHDMVGNVLEWCWDWYESNYYVGSPASDPRGPAGPLIFRVLRGGSWGHRADRARVACRNDFVWPDYASKGWGFRSARGL